MKILIVGGTGMIGGHAAAHLAAQGAEVTVAARKPAPSGTPMEKLPILFGDYSRGTFQEKDLEPFDAIVFAAGNDIRHLPKNVDESEFWRVNQIEGVPNFVALAKRAGVRRVVQLGSYYHQAMPHLVGANAYVRARALADEGARALASADFNVSTLNPPSIVGAIPGVPARRYETLTAWAKGLRPEIPDYAPAGGTNYMSVRSLSEAVWGALQRAESGKAYLIGDANLTFRAFFQKIFDEVGSKRLLVERDQEHPLLPDAFIVPGRGAVLAYEPDPVETQLLGYRRGDVDRAIAEVVRTVDGILSMADEPDAMALRRLADRYAVAVDRGDGEMFAAQFTPEGVLIAPRGAFIGRKALAQVPSMMRELYFKTFHAVLTQASDINGDRATGETYCIARHFYRDEADGPMCYEMTLRYQDAFERKSGQWLIGRRELIVDAAFRYAVEEMGAKEGGRDGA